MPAVARYRMQPFWRVQILGMFGVFAAAAVLMIVAAIAGHGPPLSFAAFWIIATLWLGYWFLFRIVYELELAAAQLRWRTPLRSGTEDLIGVIELRPSSLAFNAEVVELADGRQLLVFVRKGFKEFTDELAAARPGLEVRLGFQARLAEKLPGWSGYKRKPD